MATMPLPFRLGSGRPRRKVDAKNVIELRAHLKCRYKAIISADYASQPRHPSRPLRNPCPARSWWDGREDSFPVPRDPLV